MSKNLIYIVKEACLKYALSACRTKGEAARMLGLNESAFEGELKKFKVGDTFKSEDIFADMSTVDKKFQLGEISKINPNAKNFKEVISFAKQIDKLIVITRGEKGSIAIQKNIVFECDSKKNIKIKDLTGAGDLFAAGFLNGYVNGLMIEKSLQMGTDMASKIIQKIGARLN